MNLLTALLLLAVSGFVRDGSVEIIFPQAIRFSVNLTIPATEITGATLTITPDGGVPILLNVDVEQASLSYGEPEARLVYTWRIPADNPPPLFGAISYEWAFTAADGSSGSLDDSFTFSDPRFDWQRSLDPQGHFNVTAPRAMAPLLDALPQVRSLLEQNTGTQIDDNLLIYPMAPGCTPSPDDDTQQIAVGADGESVTCDAGITDAALAGYHLLVIPSDTTAEAYTVAALARQAYAPLWEGKDVPAWFSEGLAQFYAPTPKNALQPPAEQAARAGTLLSLADMGAAQDSTLWRAQSFGVILYIANQIGAAGLFDLARVDAPDFDAAYQQAMTVPLSGLIAAWQQWLFTRSADADYGITPYQPPTVTPTVTPTASDTPTVTPTATDTPTVTPTASTTPRGYRGTYAPPPTVTPSETHTPRPPTVTPRPPGSLLTVTPTPTPLQTAITQPGVQAGAATFLLLVLALLVFLLFRLGNRR